jgi:uncharacterized protein
MLGTAARSGARPAAAATVHRSGGIDGTDLAGIDCVLSRYLVATPSLRDPSGHRRRLLFSTRSCERVLLDESLWAALVRGAIDDLSPGLVAELRRVRILVDRDEDELGSIIARNLEAIDDRDVLEVVVQPTAACQLGCGYCGQEHGPRTLDAKQQQAFVERTTAALAAGDYQALSVGWFGAEPLLGLGVMRTMSPALRAAADRCGVDYHSRVCTNGLLFTPAIARELERDHGVRFTEITLDGTEGFHNRRRVWKSGRPSFHQIFDNLVAVANTTDVTMELSVRCNVDRENARGVEPLIDLLADHGLQDRIRFYTSPIHDWGNEAGTGSLDLAEYAALEVGWLAHQFERGFSPGVIPGPQPVVCFATSHANELIDSDGNLFNCTEVSFVPAYGTPNEFALGHIDGSTGPATRGYFGDWNQHVQAGTVPCSTCRILPVCGGACPKAWYDGTPPCPSVKHNIVDRMLLDLARSTAAGDA